MKTSSFDNFLNVPKHKLNPPSIVPEKLLQRSDLLEKLKYLQADKKKLLIIEASAGSGKSVFAHQYVQENSNHFGWLQIGNEDQDPVLLLNALVTLVTQKLPDFRSGNVLPALLEGAIHPSEAPRFGAILAEELNTVKGNKFSLVLDDLHLLDGSKESTELLISFIQHMPAWVQLILISRQSVKSILQVNQFNKPSLTISNEELDFSIEESAQLFQSVLFLALSFEQIHRIQRQTEGWITGLVLIAFHSANKEKSAPQGEINFTSNSIPANLSEFFMQDVLATVSQERFYKLLMLVLLEDMPIELIGAILGKTTEEDFVLEMERSNRFFRCIDEDKEIYSFHHLFRESLLPVAKKHLAMTDQTQIFQEAVKYHLNNKEQLRALHYAVLSGEISICEDLLSQFGFELLRLNHIKTLHRILLNFPEETITNYPWLSYYYGTCLQNSQPFQALHFLIRAQGLFSELGNEIGMLLADSQIIEFHAMIDGQFNLMETHIAELEKIFTRKHESLSPSLKLKIAYALALGNCFLHSDIQKVRHYDTLALKLSVDNQFDNMTVSIRFIRAYRCCFVGDLRGARDELEASLPYLKNLRVSTITKLFLRTLQVNLVEMAGDFNNYRDQKQNLERVVEQDVISQSIIGPFINIWDIDSALAENDIDTAERVSQIALQKSFAASEAHMRSQFLGYYALVLSYKQKKKEALEAIHESYSLRQQVGGNSYIFLNHQMLGAAYAQLGLIENALEHFTKALTLADKIGDTWQRCSIYAQRAWMQSEAGLVDPSVQQDVKQCLKYMRENDYCHFFTYMPHVMERVLQLALRFDIEPVFTRQFLAKKFNKGVDRKGETIPLLNIKLLSGLTLNSGNDRQLNVQELTDYEQQLLNAIIVSPGLQIPDTAVSLQLWPDKNQLKQRSSLDTLVFRLRKKLNDLVHPAKSMEYLHC